MEITINTLAPFVDGQLLITRTDGIFIGEIGTVAINLCTPRLTFVALRWLAKLQEWGWERLSSVQIDENGVSLSWSGGTETLWGVVDGRLQLGSFDEKELEVSLLQRGSKGYLNPAEVQDYT